MQTSIFCHCAHYSQRKAIVHVCAHLVVLSPGCTQSLPNVQSHSQGAHAWICSELEESRCKRPPSFWSFGHRWPDTPCSGDEISRWVISTLKFWSQHKNLSFLPRLPLLFNAVLDFERQAVHYKVSSLRTGSQVWYKAKKMKFAASGARSSSRPPARTSTLDRSRVARYPLS